jgi:hypothetical protein
MGVFIQRFDASGAPVGGEFQVNTAGATAFQYPAVAMDAPGNFVVAWQADFIPPPIPPVPPDRYFVYAQRFDAAGARVGPEHVVPSSQSAVHPDVAMTDGGSLLVWNSFSPGPYGVFARRFDAAGAPAGSEFHVDSGANLGVYRAAIGTGVSGPLTIAWEAQPPATGSLEVFARRLGYLAPSAMAVDVVAGGGSDANGVLEAGESAAVDPAWANAGSFAVSFAGAASGFTGPGAPGDPSYTLTDAAADYGPIAGGGAGGCRDTSPDCYAVSVSVPTARPADHWDAGFDEALTGGGGHRWTLHVGDSFGDVPRTSPFYRFVETLLHRQVTAGCAAGTYCPATPTSRAEMAVFVLVAKEGAAYVPSACTPPDLFQDVPASSPFCRWVEELSRRGVVSGCGTGLYCPSAPVSREQMAVFVLRTLDPTINPPACGSPIYLDVPASSAFCRWIEELTRRGVVSGCGGGNYCPSAAVSRAQMGVFLGVTFGLTLYGP